MFWHEWVFLGLFALLLLVTWCARHIPPTCWYISRRKRSAMRVALRTAQMSGHVIDWEKSRVVRTDREKCFVILQNAPPVGRTPEWYRMYAVWSDTSRVDDMGDWVFHWGIFPCHAIEIYEKCRAEGRPWPNGFSEACRDLW